MPPSHHVASNQHVPSAHRYDPQYDKTTIPSHRQSLSHEQFLPQRRKSALQRSHNEDIEKQRAMPAAWQGQPLPNPSFVTSEFSDPRNGSNVPRWTARAKQNSKEDDYPPANHACRCKLPISQSNMIANPASSAVLTSNHVGSVSQSVVLPTTSVPPLAVWEGSQL